MLLSTLLGPNSNSALDKHYYLRLLVLTVTKKHERNTSGNSNNCASLGCNSCSHHVLLHLCITSYEWKKTICQCSNSGQCTCLEETQYWLKTTRQKHCIVKWCNYDSLLIYSSRQYPPPPPQWKRIVLWPPSFLAEIPVFELISSYCFKWIWIFETSLHLGVSNHFGGGSMDIFWGCIVQYNWNISGGTLKSSGERANSGKDSRTLI